MFNVQFSIINFQFPAGQNIFILNQNPSTCASWGLPAGARFAQAGNEPMLSKTLNALRAIEVFIRLFRKN